MRGDDRDDPFDEFFREIERMMAGMTGGNVGVGSDAGFGDDAHFTVYEEGDTLRVVGDLPGVEKENIDVKCDGRYLTVSAGSTRREYEERLTLPAPVDEYTASASFNNGVLEIVLDRVEDSADIDLT
jgi:HSP20 family protein